MDRDLYLEQKAAQDSKYLEQQEREQRQADLGVAQYFRSREGLPPSFGTPERQVLSKHVHAVRDEVETLQLSVLAGERIKGINVWGMPILSQDADKLAVIVLNIMWNSYGETLTAVCMNIAKAVKEERRLDNLKHTHHDIWSKIKRFKGNVKGSSFYKYRKQIGEVDEHWDHSKKIHVGNALMEACFRATNLFHYESRRCAKTKYNTYFLSIDPRTLLEIEDSHEDLALLHPSRMPMIVPPCDWEDRWCGGYLGCTDKYTCHTPLVVANLFQRLPHLTADDFGDHLHAINNLQKTKWVINEKIHGVIDHVFHHNLQLGDLLRRDPDPYPPKPEDFKYNPSAKTAWKEEARQIGRYNKAMLGARTSMLIAIDQARQLKRYDEFYYVWYLDWRGRMSPRGNTLIPQGSDPCKAMLRFKEGKELGERGLYWLTIHLANCMGVDKKPYDERVQYVHTMADEIHRWAKDPLEYKGWADQDDPYLALAAAVEWSSAYSLHNPCSFISHLPINMDGTTNGLQHLSALGRDLVGAKATNLTPTDHPNDIYGQVAGVCNNIINKDFEEWIKTGAPHADYVRELTCPAEIAATRRLIGSANWKDRVDRKVCKRATMTRAYSVTRQGVRRQLLDDGFLEFAKDDPNMDVNIAADYMRDCVWEAQGEIVKNATHIMDWLKEVAAIALEEDQSIVWRTPAGMLVDMGYLRPLKRDVHTADRKYTVNIQEGERKLMARKQINAVAPNFIHSLDASHLTRVVQRLYNMGITDMMMIHDSYGVHACHVDTMQRIIREEFVKMHEENPLQDFKEGLEAYLDSKLPDLPEVGDYDIKDMLDAQYAFC